MNKYICKKAFALKKYDDDGFVTEDYIDVSVGDVYRQADEPLFITVSPAIRLKNDSGIWMELYPETLDEYFVEAAMEGGGARG